MIKLITLPVAIGVNVLEMGEIGSEAVLERFEKFVDEANEIDDMTRPARVKMAVEEANMELTKQQEKLDKLKAKIAKRKAKHVVELAEAEEA